MFVKIALIIAFLTVCSADPIPYKDCGSSTGITGASVDIGGCSKFPCIFTQGTNITVTINFKTLQPFKLIQNIVYGWIAGVKVPFPLPQQDACKNGITCPLDPNMVYMEVITMPILAEYPAISLYVQFQLNDETGNPALCAYFPAKIAKPSEEKKLN